ncbi:MAG: transketolase [Candidatus Eisenbacteria bacterium]|nr:transketolase [Candidatus Eisenbacteria bacterium]
MSSVSTAPSNDKLDQLAVNTLRFLAADTVEKAKSGHPGMPMGMADVAYTMWTKFMRWQPQDPAWAGRDRFVLSAGHGSALLYSTLHLAGFEVSMEDLQSFRQLGSRTPGHPEYGWTPGVEVTTGPLGQGIGNAVGMALAARMGAARFNTSGFAPVDWRVFGICGDGDLMEGLSHEAASLAGHLGLGNIVFVYDDNHITIEGDTSLAFSEDVAKRFESYGWQVLRANPYDHADLSRGLAEAIADESRPSLVICRSHIGYGAPHKQDTSHVHGEPLGAEELAAAKKNLGWPESPMFHVPAEARERFTARATENRRSYDAWNAGMKTWRAADPARAAQWDAIMERRVPSDLVEQLCAKANPASAATRAHGNTSLQHAAALVPALVGGSADLEPSTKTRIKDSPSVSKTDFSGRNLHFGIREHGMGAIMNGMALATGFIPYGSSFLVFTDYARPSIRLSAIMKLPSIWVFTHDSIFVGEDGPTHQPVEHLEALRVIPNLHVIRPADGLETAAAWGLAIERKDGPTLIALSRQNTAVLTRPGSFETSHLRRGGYVLVENSAPGAVTIVATGSEVGAAVDAAARLAAQGIAARVVSMPAPTIFLEQDAAWRDSVLPPGGRRVSFEAATTGFWRRIVGESGLCIGIDRYGESAPAPALAAHFGFTGEAVAGKIAAWVAG